MVICMLKKIEYTKNNLLNTNIIDIFICPICHDNIKISDNSLICDKNHCYDILPYTYVLDVSDVWIKKFETITLQAPSWKYF